MKILVVSNMFPDDSNPSYGIFVKRFCDQLSLIGIQYETAVMLKGSSKIDKIFKYILFYVGGFLKCLFGQYDVVYIHYASHSSLGVLLARKLKKFNIYTNLHGSDVVPENAGQAKMQKYTMSILAESEKVIVPSEYFKQLVADKYGILKDKIFVYPSAGVDTKVFYLIDDAQKRRAREAYGINSARPTFGYVGRISTGKGWDTFVEAIAKFDGEANWVIVGDGPERTALDKKIHELGLKDKVCRLGLQPQGELSKIYGMLDFFVFPTQREGESLGLVALEAMACGTPVIASDFAAPKYYVQDGVNGYKFTVGNVSELANVLRQAQDVMDTDRYLHLRKNAFKTAENYATDLIEMRLRRLMMEGYKVDKQTIIDKKIRGGGNPQ